MIINTYTQIHEHAHTQQSHSVGENAVTEEKTAALMMSIWFCDLKSAEHTDTMATCV